MLVAEAYKRCSPSFFAADSMEQFTDDIWTHVFSLLDSPVNQGACAQTCKAWHCLEREARRSLHLRSSSGILPCQLAVLYPGEWVSFSLVEDNPMVIEPDYRGFSLNSFGHSADPWLEMLSSKESLTAVTLGNVHISYGALARFLDKRGSTLRHLQLQKVSGISGAAMDLISEHCGGLETLGVGLDTGSGFAWAAKCQSKGSLTSLASSDWNGAPPSLVAPLVSSFHNIESIDLSNVELWFFQKDGARVFEAVAGLRKLTELKLPFDIDLENLLLFQPVLPQIKCLELFDTSGFVQVAPSLTSLVECHTFGSLERFRQLGLWSKQLRKASFQTEETDEAPLKLRGLRFLLAGCKKLDGLFLNDVDLGELDAANEIAAIQEELSRLRTLRLCWFWQCRPSALGRTNACQILQSCLNLTRLELAYPSNPRARVTADQELELVSNVCHSLRYLKLEQVRTSVPGLALIAVNCKLLTGLELVQVAVGDVEIAAVAQHCKQLRTLRLVDCQLSKFAISAIASGLPNLVTLFLEREQKAANHVAGTFRQQRFMHLPQKVKRPFDKTADRLTMARPFWVAESYAGVHRASMIAYPVLMSARGSPWGGLSSKGQNGDWLTDSSRTTVFGPYESVLLNKGSKV